MNIQRRWSTKTPRHFVPRRTVVVVYGLVVVAVVMSLVG